MEQKSDTARFKCRECGAPVQSANIYLCPTCTEKILGSGLSAGMRRSLGISGFPVSKIQPKNGIDLGNIILPDVNKEKE